MAPPKGRSYPLHKLSMTGGALCKELLLESGVAVRGVEFAVGDPRQHIEGERRERFVVALHRVVHGSFYITHISQPVFRLLTQAWWTSESSNIQL